VEPRASAQAVRRAPPADVKHWKIAAVIPAYFAADSIARVIAEIPAWVDTIYVVDDASIDGTGAAAAAANDRRVQIIRHERNRGVGAATVTGYGRAFIDGADICVKMDADGQMDPAYLPELIEPLVSGRADYVKGNRFHDATALRSMPLTRRIGNAGLSFLIKAASGQWHIFDPTNGYTAIHRSALGALELSRLHPRYFFESSMLIRLKEVGALIEDVPIPARYGDEQSHLSVGHTLMEFPWLLMKSGLKRILWQYFVADFNAVSLFLLTGLPLILFGAGFGVYHWILSLLNRTLASTGTVMLAVLPFILGFQLILQALVLDVGSTPPRPLQSRRRTENLS
jgi:glycosyltransferase involved in cell wall biosynthesis